ncbi:hypothetical protein SCP_0903120 [Sparassis crispa]|uniref:Uncharacterized protein n=1 Tax=Sparassis crispa TaxID=139825 RepID=A0A401GW72_9APHY|nr:hypothetical protein SCP_0903120 [Sparassis crispa]GBE86433.1 hypothetical protein SCP_0903120 [Sparassis crispa]
MVMEHDELCVLVAAAPRPSVQASHSLWSGLAPRAMPDIVDVKELRNEDVPWCGAVRKEQEHVRVDVHIASVQVFNIGRVVREAYAGREHAGEDV